ncbi:MAG: PBP1A family penicillin-binding protein [Actinobacteria bacterium]|nr:MAG: PBP1A family penicillin-binding protein [Actinomycetota bacterium]
MRAIGCLLLFLVAAALVVGGLFYYSVVRDVPQIDDLKAQQKGRDQTTVILDKDGGVLAKLYAEENRTDVKLADVPPALRNGVVAVEDKRFYEHKGVDPLGILRAFLTDVKEGEAAQGGSTITQQLVKQAFLTAEKTAKRKIREAVLANRIESRMDKDEILELYLNTIYYGHGSYGVEAASQAYFGKHAKDLSLAESALIAGVIRSPGNYSPYLQPDAAKERRDLVLRLMAEQGYITAAEQAAAAATPVKTAGLKGRQVAAPYFVEYLKAQLIATGKVTDSQIYRGGLTIRTTLDPKMQKAAEAAIAGTLDRESDPSAALVALDPKTGAVLAMVGGRDFATQQFNAAVQGHRQPGSAFKPFVLATALGAGVSPEAAFECGPMTLKVPGAPDWKVTGASGGRTGKMRLREATEQSVNSVYAQLILQVGADETVETAEKMGISTKLNADPAIALGGLETGVSPIEMASAYGTLANGGTATQPYGIVQVTNQSGAELLAVAPKPSAGIDPAVAYLETDMLTGVITRGTGTAAAIGRPAAGKTGTTQEYRDAWFVGYTPDLVAAVWVGYPEAQREMTNVHGRKVTGGSFPAQIWAKFMKAALAGRKAAGFVKPDGLVSKQYCADTGLLATDFCPKKAAGLFLADNLPKTCDVHIVPITVKMPNLVGMTKEAAAAALQKLLLTFKVIEKDVPGKAAGTVTDQTPVAGSTVTTTTPITLTVATGSNANKAPTASFKVTPAQGQVGKVMTFDASDSTDADGTIVKYLWEFGDGGTAEGKTASHTFSGPSPATGWSVTLWLTDDDGATASAAKSVVVK